MTVDAPVRKLKKQKQKMPSISKWTQLSFLEFVPGYCPPDLKFYTGLSDKEMLGYSIALHQMVLDESLSTVRSSAGGGDPIEILSWIYSPDFIDWSVKTEEGSIFVRRHQRDIPFSFMNCCLASNYNPDVLRSEFSYELPDLKWVKKLKNPQKLLDYVKQFS